MVDKEMYSVEDFQGDQEEERNNCQGKKVSDEKEVQMANIVRFQEQEGKDEID